MEITFHGATGTVTGSRFLVRSGGTSVLVDAGLFQGVKVIRQRNWRQVPFAPSELDAVVLTHAHIDHSGYLPVLTRKGFGGPVYCTRPTADLCRILWPDSARLLEEEAGFANRKGFSRHRPARPLYTEQDARRALEQLRPVGLGETVRVGDLRVGSSFAGHILGAVSVSISDGTHTIVFSGDLGRPNDLLIAPPVPPPAADLLVMESTYGDRRHADDDPVAALGEVVRRTVERGGITLVPAFAVGRAQAVVYALERAFERRLAPRVPIYLNSPMASDVTELYLDHDGWQRLTPSECGRLCAGVHFVSRVEESKALARRRDPAVIVSASGMLTGGRVLHHLEALAPGHENTIAMVGFQAPGTRGATLLEGAPAVKVHGRYVPVHAEIVQLDVLSAHADQGELLAWLASAAEPPARVLLVHGEPVASDTLRRRIDEELGLDVRAAEDGERVVLQP